VTITREQRDLIRERAGDCCEYCRVAQGDRLSKFQIDHIIPVKHGGSDDIDNLCLACLKCNGFKGPNVAALDPVTGEATKLYDPRRQKWDDHFQINPDATLTAISPAGRATLVVLRINEDSRVKQRRMAMLLGEYPCERE
jgi:hypothetical protein